VFRDDRKPDTAEEAASLARSFFEQGRFGCAHAHVERGQQSIPSGSRAVGEAIFWYRQHLFGEVKPGALHALGVFEKLGPRIMQSTLESSSGGSTVGLGDLDLETHEAW